MRHPLWQHGDNVLIDATPTASAFDLRAARPHLVGLYLISVTCDTERGNGGVKPMPLAPPRHLQYAVAAGAAALEVVTRAYGRLWSQRADRERARTAKEEESFAFRERKVEMKSEAELEEADYVSTFVDYSKDFADIEMRSGARDDEDERRHVAREADKVAAEAADKEKVLKSTLYVVALNSRYPRYTLCTFHKYSEYDGRYTLYTFQKYSQYDGMGCTSQAYSECSGIC
jgi:hypothetical protein